MADDRRDVNEANTRGTDWEVVSLTASTFAAAPGPQGFDPTVQHKKDDLNEDEHECSETMIMSKHFAAAKPEPEKLPAEDYCSEIYDENIHNEKITDPQKDNKDKFKIDANDDLHGSQLFGMGSSLLDHGISLGDRRQEEDLKVSEKEHALFVSPNYSSFNDEANASLPVIQDDIFDLAMPRSSSQENLDYPSWQEHGCKKSEENKNESFDESSESWWKKQAMSVYNHAKGTNSFWSIFVAVAVAGLVFVGQRWRREKSQFQQFKWNFIGSGEKINRIAGPVNRFNYLIGGNQRGGSMQGIHPTF